MARPRSDLEIRLRSTLEGNSQTFRHGERPLRVVKSEELGHTEVQSGGHVKNISQTIAFGLGMLGAQQKSTA